MVVFEHTTIILDASCVISLYASEHMAEILKALPPEITIATYVAQKEALYFRSDLDDDGKNAKIPIDLNPLIQQKLLTLVKEDSEDETDLHLKLAAQIRGKGEVTTAAIAINRNWGIVVDDRRARNLFQAEAPHIQLLGNLDLVRYWAESNEINDLQINTVLQRIKLRSAFNPKPSNDNYTWWQTHI